MQFNHYKIGAEIGRGGMAIVYQAHDLKFDTVVAVKFLNREFVNDENIRNRFFAEAKNMFRMSHPNIIKVTDFIDEGDVVAFVMEFAEGVTLKEYIDRKGRLKDEEIRSIFAQMLDAVGYVHDQRLVHRDIKPSNFMIDDRGKIKLMDFGIAKALDPSSSEYTQTETGMQMGTPMYMSPEQVKGSSNIGKASDIYSLGVVLWQMVMSRKPYDSHTLSHFEMQLKILQESLPRTGTAWDVIIAKATSKEPSQRFKSISEYYLAIERPTTDITEETIFDNSLRNKSQIKNPSNVVRDRKFKRRIFFITSSAVLVLVTILIFIFREKDFDGDGITDQNDLCPNVFGLASFMGCPDSDGDGITDSGDLCPQQIGPSHLQGCPDGDNDGLADKDDRCPEQFGLPLQGGCPDRDHDGIADYIDACPDKFGNNSDGCFYYKSVTFRNLNSWSTRIAIGYYYNSDWHSIGWFNLEPNDEYTHYLPDKFEQEFIYWYDENGYDMAVSRWFCIYEDGDFHHKITFDENCPSETERGFRKHQLTNDKNVIYIEDYSYGGCPM